MRRKKQSGLNPELSLRPVLSLPRSATSSPATGLIINTFGLDTFKAFDREIKNVRKLYPNADYVGVADGAADNRTFLQSRVEEQILDFYHASEYLSKASKAAFKNPDQASRWLEKVCHTLKEEVDGTELVLRQMKEFLNRQIKEDKKEIIQSSITYFTNHLHQMNYSKYKKNNLPIGSGFEAACKVIVKKRLCNSGMKWTDNRARTVLALRCFNKSDGMWEQFWNKVIKYLKSASKKFCRFRKEITVYWG